MVEVIELDNKTREKLQEGIRNQAKAVANTMGPVSGQNKAARDDARENPQHSEKNEGARLINELVARTAETVGDATATAAVLGRSLMCSSLQQISEGASPLGIKKGLEEGLSHFAEFLKTISEPVLEPAQLSAVATTAAKGDSKLGGLVSEAFEKVGQQGEIRVKPSDSAEANIEVHESTALNARYFCPYCRTEPTKSPMTFEEPLLLLTNHRTITSTSLMPLLDQLTSAKRQILIITDAVDGEALPAFILNHPKGLIKVSFLRAPKASGVATEEILEDIALLTGGRLIDCKNGDRIEDVRVKDLGSAGKLEVTQDFTFIKDGQGSPEQVETRKNKLEALLNQRNGVTQRSNVKERIAFLRGGEATIFLPASSRDSFAANKKKVEAAIHASRAALSGGMVPGGGLAFLMAHEAQGTLQNSDSDEAKGLELFRQALLEPAMQIAETGGAKGRAIVNEAMKEPGGYGYNATTGKFEPLLEAGIADATSMLLAATKNAVAVTGEILSTYREKKEVAA